MISIMVEIFVQPLVVVCCARLYFILTLSFTMLFFSFIPGPVWNTSSGMGGIPPSNNTVINQCDISFLLNHDPDLRISPRHCRRLVPLQEGQCAFVASKENRFLNEFFLYVLEDLHTCQSLGALQFTSDDPTFVTLSSVFTPSFRQLQPPQRCNQPGPSRGSSLPTWLSFFQSLHTSGQTTAGFPAFAMTSTQQPSNVWRRQATRRSSFT
jgi:hypothetical protein